MEAITAELEETANHSVMIPASCTGELQLMDISVNKVIKSQLRSKCCLAELTELFTNGNNVDVSTEGSDLKKLLNICRITH